MRWLKSWGTRARLPRCTYLLCPFLTKPGGLASSSPVKWGLREHLLHRVAVRIGLLKQMKLLDQCLVRTNKLALEPTVAAVAFCFFHSFEQLHLGMSECVRKKFQIEDLVSVLIKIGGMHSGGFTCLQFGSLKGAPVCLHGGL